MKKIAALLFLMCLTSQAYAIVPCHVQSFYDGYSGTFPNPVLVKGFTYGLDETFMWILFTSGSAAGFPNVPQGIAQSINYTKTPDQFYATQIKPIYKQVLQAEDCKPLLAQTGSYLLA